MKKSTKAVAWLWVFANVFSLGSHYIIFKRDTLLISVLITLVVLAFAMIPAMSLLKGGKAGWWTIALYCSYSVLSAVVVRICFQSVKWDVFSGLNVILHGVCLILLLSDLPSKWPARECTESEMIWHRLSMFITVLVVLLIAFLVMPMLYGGFDRMTDAVSGKATLK